MNKTKLLTIQYGGKKKGKIFNLDADHNFGSDVQENLKKIYSKYGKRFKIKKGDKIVPAHLQKIIIKMSDDKIFNLKYDDPKRFTDLIPFSISFIDPHKSVKNNICYIANIHKTEQLTGSKMINLVLDILRTLKVEKAYLGDGATVRCAMDNEQMNLSQIKMIEKFRTFYMKFGFQFDCENRGYWSIRTKNKEQFKKKIFELIDNIRKIEIAKVIKGLEKTVSLITKATLNGDFKNLRIQHLDDPDIIPEEVYDQYDPYVDLPYVFQICSNVLNILRKTKKKYLYEYLVELFNDFSRCHEYNTLYKFLTNSKFYNIIYKKENIKVEYKSYFKILTAIVHWNIFYVYDFTK